MADYTKSKSGPIRTQRKDPLQRKRALGQATRGRTKRGQNETVTEPEKTELSVLVPEARQDKPRTYKMLEHRRRDTGAVIWALDLTAPDAPEKRVVPIKNDDDVLLEFAAVCVTHQNPPVHVATAARARREAKWSHKWCEGCRGDQARTPATRSKANSKARGNS